MVRDVTPVRWDLNRAHPRTALTGALHQEYRIPDPSNPSGDLDRATVGELFHQMTSAGRFVWFIDLFRWGGAAISIRKAADDPSLATILTFNRHGQPPIEWRVPRRRFHPDELRKAYVERRAAEENPRALP